MTDALPLKTSQVNAYTMKLVEKKHANSSDELRSIERKVRHLELDNVRLRAASLNAKKKLARMKHVKPEIHRRETIPTVDFSVEGAQIRSHLWLHLSIYLTSRSFK